MKKTDIVRVFIFSFLLCFWVRDAFPKQVHTFELNQNGVALKFRVSLPKDSFNLMETVTFDVTVKNISNQPLINPSTKSLWWTIKNENGLVYKYPGTLISTPSALEVLKPGASINWNVPLEAVKWDEKNIDPPILYSYFPTGKYEVYYGPDTDPFVFHITINQNSKNHLRRKMFVEFCYTHSSTIGFFDTAWGVPNGISTGNDLVKSFVDTNLTEKAYKFFDLNRELFGMSNPRLELKVYKITEEEQGIEVWFKQYYKDLETSKDYCIVARFTEDGELKKLSGTFYPDINLSITPKVTKMKALDIAIKDLDPKSKGGYRNSVSPSLMVFPYMRKYYLAWFIFVNRWRYFIDANDGHIIHKKCMYKPCVNE